jgi:hypothetical protein
MHSLSLMIIGLGAFLAGFLVLEFVSIAVLRCFGFNLNLSFAFHILSRRESEILAALKGRSEDTYVLVSGFLLLACPLFVGMILFDYIRGDFNVSSVIGSVVVFAVVGFVSGVSNWKKAARADSVSTTVQDSPISVVKK